MLCAEVAVGMRGGTLGIRGRSWDGDGTLVALNLK